MAKFLAMNIINSEIWQRSSTLQAIHEDLNWIKRAVSNGKLCQVFERKVRARLSPGYYQSSRVNEVAVITRNRRQEISALGAYNIREHDKANEHQKEAARILTEGCASLNEDGRLSANDLKEISLAIDADGSALAKELESNCGPMNLDTQNILVYFMDNPERQPEVISEEYSKYFQIGWYMSHNHEIDEVDVWIRHRNHHSLTADGLFWEYTRPTQTVVKSATTLEVDVVDVRTRDRYIVALLQDESRKESPVLLNLGKGRGSCCNSNCSNLWFHLRNIWPSQYIVRAQRFSDSQDDLEVSSKVLSWPLNEHYFDNQKNELYLECKPEVITCEPSDVVNKMEGAEKP